ncbi:MAG: sugar phosphate isomerase/epimerase family protein, partial [Aeromicrobium sp.]
NQAEGPECLRDITPHLDLAEMLGSDLIRICMKEAADVAPARAAADEAAERGIRLAHQSHHTSLFETVEGSLETVRSVDRPNFGIIYEPANLAMCGEDYGRRTIEAFAPYLFNVYLQNQVPDSAGDFEMNTWARGRVVTRLRPLDEPGGIDFEEIFAALRAVGYEGCITSHQASEASDGVEEVTRRYASFLRSLIEV